MSWTSPQTIGGILGVLAFGLVAYGDLRRGVMLFTAGGCIRNIQIGAFAGSEMVQGLLPVEALLSVLFAIWVLKRGGTIRRAPFNVTLFLFLPISVVSLIVGFVSYDPNIAVDHMKVSVSFAQILLTMWPIGAYLVVANSVNDTKTIEQVEQIIIALAVPSLVMVVMPDAWPWVKWSTTFALPASSICFAKFWDEKVLWRRAALLLVVVGPIFYGLAMGKAFYYAYVVVSCGVILLMRAPKMLLAGVPLAMVLYVVAVPLASDSLTPKFLTGLVEEETEQQSLGGTGGRDTLIMDGLGIWSRSPILGVGPGNNYPYMLRYSSLGTAHNQYLNLLIELGVVGTLCFLAFAAQALRVGLRFWRTTRVPAHRRLVLSWCGIFSAFLVGGFFGDFMLPSIRNAGLELFAEFYVQWIILGLVVAAAAIERRTVVGTRTYEYA